MPSFTFTFGSVVSMGAFYKIKMCYCCSRNSPGSAVDLISESAVYVCALWFWEGLGLVGCRVSQGERGPVFHCHITTVMTLVVGGHY